MKKHIYPIVRDIGLNIHETLPVEFSAFGSTWKFQARNQAEVNLAKGCLTFYKHMWLGELCEPLSRQDTVVDIGAHSGFFCLPIAHMVKKVVAYEPAPANFKNLEINHLLNPSKRVLKQNAAVGAVTRSLPMYLSIRGTTGHSITTKKQGGVQVVVECISIADVIEKYSPAALKIDCEGGEWDILTDSYLLNNVKIVIAELHKVHRHDLHALEDVLREAEMDFSIKCNSWNLGKLIAWRK